MSSEPIRQLMDNEVRLTVVWGDVLPKFTTAVPANADRAAAFMYWTSNGAPLEIEEFKMG